MTAKKARKGVFDVEMKRQNRKPRTTNLDTRLYLQVRELAERLDVKINDLLEEAMSLLLEKYGIEDPRK